MYHWRPNVDENINNMAFWYESLFWVKFVENWTYVSIVIIMSKCVNPEVYTEVCCEVWQ